jgi:methylenetetrahydrofolate reductase (NADPH)
MMPDNKLSVSFEFFPPKTEPMLEQLWQAVKRLEPLGPAFVSVTYGAGGSTRERTHQIVRRIQAETSLRSAAHLTCVGATRAEVDNVARDYWATGIRHIVALRGDPPGGQSKYAPHPGGYAFAVDLVGGLTKIAAFELSVAAYPETHLEAQSPRADLDNLQRKVDAGATRAIAQFFFDNRHYFDFLERARKAGIKVPIVPGILPVTNFAKVVQFANKCGVSIPRWLADAFDGLDDDPETRQQVAAAIAIRQCQDLRDEGVRHFHFYTLNRADLTYSICHILGLRPPRAAPKAVASVG